MNNRYTREQNKPKKTPQTTQPNVKPGNVTQRVPLYSKYSGPELIKYAYEEFRNVYKNKVKQTTINSIVNGEIISTKPINIFVDEECVYEDKVEITSVDEINKIPFEERKFIRFVDAKFNDKLKLSTKTLYNYQINAIKKISQVSFGVGGHIFLINGFG